jgi:hypothetical protein
MEQPAVAPDPLLREDARTFRPAPDHQDEDGDGNDGNEKAKSRTDNVKRSLHAFDPPAGEQSPPRNCGAPDLTDIWTRRIETIA